jgi:hypothetical protein
MLIKVSYVAVLLLAVCCSFSPVKDRQLTKKTEVILPDSVFKYFKKKHVNEKDVSPDYDAAKQEYKLVALTSQQRIFLTDKVLGARPYGAYFFSKQAKVKDIQPILIYTYADDYSSVLLFNLSKDDEAIDHLELTASICDVIDQTEEKEVVGCHERYSEFLNDSTVRMTDLKIIIDGYGKKGEFTTTDSLITDYRIAYTGKILQLKKDSIRYSKRTK